MYMPSAQPVVKWGLQGPQLPRLNSHQQSPLYGSILNPIITSRSGGWHDILFENIEIHLKIISVAYISHRYINFEHRIIIDL